MTLVHIEAGSIPCTPEDQSSARECFLYQSTYAITRTVSQSIQSQQSLYFSVIMVSYYVLPAIRLGG